MLKELYIENLAVIEKASISFTENFNVFSGETGAGKSILIGAINAILGGRVSKDLIRTGTKKASVTALFDFIPAKTAEKLSEYGFEAEDEIILQREFSVDGKGIVRICGKPSTVAILKEIAAGLIDIHGQHDTRILIDSNNQRELLDNYSGLEKKLDEYGELFRSFSQISRKIKLIEDENSRKDERIEELKKQINEVEKLKLRKGMETEISEQLNKARNFEEISNSLVSAQNCLIGDENGAADMISAAISSVNRITEFVPSCAALSERLSDILIEIQDIGGEISGNIPENDSEQQLSVLEEKMSEILRLKRKYAAEFDEIIDMCGEWKNELKVLSDADNTLAELMEEKRRMGDLLKKTALELSDKRKAGAEKLTAEITEQLRFLDMPDIRMLFSIEQGKVTVHGIDSVEILISVNKGEDLKPLGKVASGGELSRIMLAIKSVLADSDDTPTMIFDEIDTGISGRAAQKTGQKLSEISGKRQVLCVTHLAQIAALSDNHLLIEKKSDDERTYTTVRSLDYNEKVAEIARIISGDSHDEASLKNAEELISKKNIFTEEA